VWLGAPKVNSKIVVRVEKLKLTEAMIGKYQNERKHLMNRQITMAKAQNETFLAQSIKSSYIACTQALLLL